MFYGIILVVISHEVMTEGRFWAAARNSLQLQRQFLCEGLAIVSRFCGLKSRSVCQEVASCDRKAPQRGDLEVKPNKRFIQVLLIHGA